MITPDELESDLSRSELSVDDRLALVRATVALSASDVSASRALVPVLIRLGSTGAMPGRILVEIGRALASVSRTSGALVADLVLADLQGEAYTGYDDFVSGRDP